MNPDTEGEFIRKKWGCGGCGLLIAFIGLLSIFTAQSYFIFWGVGSGDAIIKVSGIIAVACGVEYTGIGIVLISHFFLPYSRMSRHDHNVRRIGWVTTIVGLILSNAFVIGFYNGQKTELPDKGETPALHQIPDLPFVGSSRPFNRQLRSPLGPGQG